MPTLTEIRAVLFDVDGTLLESSEFICRGFEHTLGHYEFRIPERPALLALLGRGLNLEECYGLLTDEKGAAIDLIETHRSFQEQHLSLCLPFPGATEVLAELHQRGYRMAAITTRSRRTSLKTLQAARMLAYFEAVVSWEDVEYPKPHPDPVLRALACLGLSSEEAVMIGDTWVDIEAGRQAGAITVGVTYGMQREGVAQSKPDLLIGSLNELLDHLQDRLAEERLLSNNPSLKLYANMETAVPQTDLLIPPSIEQEILNDDRRGVTDLVPYLPINFVERAASHLLRSSGPVLIATGFYVGGAAETDGPPGAVAIGNALQRLGRSVVYVTDRYAAHLLRALAGESAPVLEVEIDDHQTSQAACRRILEETKAGFVIAIERCGQTRDGRYLNMHGGDISEYTARLDHLFAGVPSIGIGDGGNEIGMGVVYEAVRSSKRLVVEPTVTGADDLIVASVSNWGAYGLVAALSVQAGLDLMPTAAEASVGITAIVDLGAVNGVSGRTEHAVDGFTLEENLEKLERLRAIAFG